MRLRAPQDALARASAGPRRPPTRRRGPTPPRRTPARRHPVAPPTRYRRPSRNCSPAGRPTGRPTSTHVDPRADPFRSTQANAVPRPRPHDRMPSTSCSSTRWPSPATPSTRPFGGRRIRRTTSRRRDTRSPAASPVVRGRPSPSAAAAVAANVDWIPPHLLRYTLRCATVPFVWLRGCAATGEGGSETDSGKGLSECPHLENS